MDRAELVRFCYGLAYTLGWLHYDGLRLATIERPWIEAASHRGGLNRQSCVPDGEYQLHRHSSDRFPQVFALEAPELDVYRWTQTDRPGRSAILIHTGNFVADVIGCIAVGTSHTRMKGEVAVSESRIAMGRLRTRWVSSPLPRLTIRATLGTREGQQ